MRKEELDGRGAGMMQGAEGRGWRRDRGDRDRASNPQP